MKCAILAWFTVAGLAALAATGCDRGHDGASMAPGPGGVTVSPGDGAEEVAPGAAIVFQFGAPPDRAAVERNVHLYNESAPMMGEGMMRGEGMMMDGAVPGTFRWTSDTRCEFMPDAPMEPGAGYMVHMGDGMMAMMGRDEMMLHFRTAGSGPSGGEHEAHHD